MRLLFMRLRPDRFEGGALAVAAAIIAYQIFVPPLIGMADSGDFGRLIHWRGLSHVSTEYSEMYFRHFNSKYRIVPPAPGPDWYKSSTSLLIAPSRWLGMHLGNDGIFDIRLFAAPCVAVFLFGLWLILTSTRGLPMGWRIALAAFLTLILTDVGYVSYYNSFYSEGTALAFLAVGTGCYLILIVQKSTSVLYLIGYFLAIAMVITSKPQFVPLVPGFAGLGVYLARSVRAKHKYWASAAMAAGLCVLGVWYLREAPPMLRVQSAYIEIFMDMLPNSPTPREDLIEMGLNPDYAAFSGTTPYQVDSPMRDAKFSAEFAAATNSLTIPWFYAKHPRRSYGLCVRCMTHAFTTRVPRLGYYEAETGRPPRAQAPGLWSNVRERLFPRSVPFICFFLGVSVLASILWIREGSAASRGIAALCLLLVFIAVAQFLIASLVGGGEPDLEKHLFMFNLAFDACLVLLVVGAIQLLNVSHLPFRVISYGRNWLRGGRVISWRRSN